MKTNRQKHLEKENAILKEAYEEVAGQISDRQWRRIKGDLQISTHTLREIRECKAQVETYAYLRLNAPKAKITLADVRSFSRMLQEFPFPQMQGSDLKQTLMLVADRSGKGVAESTIYRWARAIGRMRENKLYDRKDVCYMASRLYHHLNPHAHTHEGLQKVS